MDRLMNDNDVYCASLNSDAAAMDDMNKQNHISLPMTRRESSSSSSNASTTSSNCSSNSNSHGNSNNDATDPSDALEKIIKLQSTSPNNNNNNSSSTSSISKVESSTGMRSRRKTSKYRGVSWLKRRKAWRSRIEYNGKQVHIGYYINEEEAARAYDMKAMEICGNTTRLNFPNEIGIDKLRDILSKHPQQQQQQQQQQSQPVIDFDESDITTLDDTNDYKREMKRIRRDNDIDNEDNHEHVYDIQGNSVNMNQEQEDDKIKIENDFNNKKQKRMNISINTVPSINHNASTTGAVSTSNTLVPSLLISPTISHRFINTDAMNNNRYQYKSDAGSINNTTLMIKYPSVDAIASGSNNCKDMACNNNNTMLPLRRLSMQLPLLSNGSFSTGRRVSTSSSLSTNSINGDYFFSALDHQSNQAQPSSTTSSPYARAPYPCSVPDNNNDFDARLLQSCYNQLLLLPHDNPIKLNTPKNGNLQASINSPVMQETLLRGRRASEQSQKMEITLNSIRRPSMELYNSIVQRYQYPSDSSPR